MSELKPPNDPQDRRWLILDQGDGKVTYIHPEDIPLIDPLGDHVNHWTIHPDTGERVEEASVIVNGWRVYWCGHTEQAS